jgi:aromatic-L-amino-acid/L-tryptophan decarboxylase
MPQASCGEFREAAHRHANWIADYFERVRDLPVLPSILPGALLDSLPRSAPETGESLDEIFSDFEANILPALTLWNHPRFFAYFSNSSTPPSVLAEMLSAALNVNAMLWKSAPAATELEQAMLSWLRQLLGLAEDFFGIIYDTASVGVMHAIAAARERIAPECRTRGMQPDLTVYISEQTHSSAEKAAIVLGFGQSQVRKIGVDSVFAMRTDLLEDAIQRDLAAGKRPCCIVASVGSTSTTAIDPVPAIADIADRFGIWLHVDAAYAGSAAVVPEMNWLLAGVDRAHSMILNPHKWLYVGMDCSVLYTRFPDVLRRAFSLSAEYLRTAEDDRVVNYMDYGIQLGRRFRALKLWYIFRYYGRQGVIALLRETLRLARLFESWVAADPAFQLCAPVPLSLVCFRQRGDNESNERLLAEINRSGKAFLSHTILNGQYVLRVAIGNFQTSEPDLVATWDLIRTTAAELVGAPA